MIWLKVVVFFLVTDKLFGVLLGVPNFADDDGSGSSLKSNSMFLLALKESRIDAGNLGP